MNVCNMSRQKRFNKNCQENLGFLNFIKPVFKIVKILFKVLQSDYIRLLCCGRVNAQYGLTKSAGSENP